MRLLLSTLAGVILVPVLALGLAIALGGPRTPPPLASISAPFQHVDMSGLPPVAHVTARDGQQLAYRVYAASAPVRGAVVAIHGSSARGRSLHPLCVALARAGYTTYAPDVRGHGESGPKGQIAYAGQLEDDLEDFVRAAAVPQPRTLAGFSAGGGFALRFAGGDRQRLFDRYVLLSPFIHQDAPTYRPGGGGWASVGIPRIVALGILDALGIRSLEGLPVTRFAIEPSSRGFLTESYSYALATSFRPHADYRADIRGMGRPVEVLVGREDELFLPDRFADVFAEAGHPVPVTVVAGVGHMGLTLEPAGIAAIVAAVERSAAPSSAPAGAR